MSEKKRYVPAVQLDDQDTVRRAIAALRARGLSVMSMMLVEVETKDRPAWVDADKGGWLLYVTESDFDRAMALLGVER